MINFRVTSLVVQSLEISYFDMVVTNSGHSSFTTNTLLFMLQSHILSSCHKHYIFHLL